MLRMTKLLVNNSLLRILGASDIWLSHCVKKKMKRTFNSRICSCCALHIRIVELIFYTQITNKPWLCNSCTVKMLCWNDCSYHYSFISGNLHWPWLFWKILRDSYLCLCKWSMVITFIFTKISIINWLLYY